MLFHVEQAEAVDPGDVSLLGAQGIMLEAYSVVDMIKPFLGTFLRPFPPMLISEICSRILKAG